MNVFAHFMSVFLQTTVQVKFIFHFFFIYLFSLCLFISLLMHIFNVIYNYAFNSHLCSNICLVMMIMIFFFVLRLFITKQQKKRLILGMAKRGEKKTLSLLLCFYSVYVFCVYSIYINRVVAGEQKTYSEIKLKERTENVSEQWKRAIVHFFLMLIFNSLESFVPFYAVFYGFM